MNIEHSETLITNSENVKALECDSSLTNFTTTLTAESKIETTSDLDDIKDENENALEMFKQVCQQLDVSDQLVLLSIKDYNAVKTCFILQGDQKLWLLCALYGLVLSISNTGTLAEIFCSKLNSSTLTTANAPQALVEIPMHNRKPNVPNYTNADCALNSNDSTGAASSINYTIVDSNNNGEAMLMKSLQLSDNSDSISLLSKLLRITKINVNFFFSKFNNWMRMIDLPKHVTQLISIIEMSEGVTCVLFQKYVQLFSLFFRTPEEYSLLDLKSNKRKTRKRPCDSNELFHFCWMLFVATKELVTVVNDVSNGFHLLLHSIKFVLINVFHESDLSASKLLAPSFTEDEEKFSQLKASPVEKLDKVFYDVLVSNKIRFLREEADVSYCRLFAPALEFLQQQRQFVFDFTACKSVIEPEHITPNLKYLIEFYRDYRILSFGIDEMEYVKLLYSKEVFVPLVITQNNNPIFNASADVLANSAWDSLIDILNDDNKNATSSTDNQPDEVLSSLSPENYASNLMNMLKKLVYNSDGSSYKNMLDQLLKTNNFNAALRKATSLPESALEVFQKACFDENSPQDKFDSCNICVDFYYKMLYTTVLNELSKSNDPEELKDVMPFISSHEFHKSLLTVCFDIYTFVNNIQKPFPWICQLFDIEPFYLTQCLELIVKSEPKLPRVIVKHLSILEEDIVSCYGWVPSSPIYTRLDSLVHGTKGAVDEAVKYTDERLSSVLPYFANVRIDGVLDYDETLVNTSEPLFDHTDPTTSGIGAYNEPMANKGGNVEVFYYLRPSFDRMISSTVSIFYQKVYHIILTRLNDFGIKLNLSRGEKALVWKCMEYILVFHTYLMKDHHLDQLLMCSIYTVMKVINKPISFGRILHNYESQPQAKYSLSRNVSSSIINTLLHNNSLSISFNVSFEKNTLEAFLSTPTIRCSTTAVASAAVNTKSVTTDNDTANVSPNSATSMMYSIPFGASIAYVVNDDIKNRLMDLFTGKQLLAMCDTHCDIIQFYNKIFSHVVQRFANEMAQFYIQKKMFVEPYPALKTDALVCPTRISQNYSVFVSPMKMSNPPTHYNPDQPSTPFFNNKHNQNHNLTNNTVRFNLANDKSPLVCREINRFVSETKRDVDIASFPSTANPVRRRLIIEEEDTRKITKFDRS